MLTILLFILLLFPSPSLALMSSARYKIFADSVDTGGILSAGGAYSLEDTIGESPVGFVTSSMYEVRGGYQAMDWVSIGMEISSVNLNLGTASENQVNTAATTVSVTTESETGYALSVGSAAGTSLANVTDGAVTAGHEEYGVAVSGADRTFSDDRGIVAGLNLSSSSTPVANTQTVLTFKAAMSGNTAPGARSQSITITAATNF